MRARVEKVKDRIHLATSAPIRRLDESIPGANWRASAKRWTFTLSMDVCRDLRGYFGPGLEIGPDLTEWARAEVARERSQAALGRNLSGIDTPRIAERYPELHKVLSARPYQSSAARFIAEGRSVLNADSMGLGKTTEAIAGILEAGTPGPYLICAPKTSLDVVWEREINMRVPDAEVWVISGSAFVRKNRLESALWDSEVNKNTWIIVNIEMIRTKVTWKCTRWDDPDNPDTECGETWTATDRPKSAVVDCGHDPSKVKTVNSHEYPALFKQPWGAIIMDECQRSLIRTSGIPTQTRAGAKLLQTRPDGLRIALSGTPMRGEPQRLFGTLKWLRPKQYTSYWAWVERFWDVQKDGYAGARTVGDFREEKEAAFNAALDGIMIRRTKEEVSPELPRKAYMGTPLFPKDPNTPVAVWLPMSPQQTKAYQEMLTSGSAQVLQGQVNTVGILAELTRLKQFANSFGRMQGLQFQPAFPSNKWDWVVQFLTEKNIIDGDELPDSKVIIVSQFTSLLKLMQDTLWEKYNVPSRSITGEITGRRRQENIDSFNDPISGYNVMFLNTTAGGVAVTLDIADDMIILDETYVPDDQEQVEDRNNNRRPEEKITQRRYWYLKSLGTVDEAIARANNIKDREQKHHLDTRRGVPYLREVYANLEEIKERQTCSVGR